LLREFPGSDDVPVKTQPVDLEAVVYSGRRHTAPAGLDRLRARLSIWRQRYITSITGCSVRAVWPMGTVVTQREQIRQGDCVGPLTLHHAL
jgi:hypothetical protein